MKNFVELTIQEMIVVQGGFKAGSDLADDIGDATPPVIFHDPDSDSEEKTV